MPGCGMRVRRCTGICRARPWSRGLGTTRFGKEPPVHGRVVVVTGGSAGVGRAAARCFAEDGADVALVARGHAGLDAAAADVIAAGRRALPISVDVADPDAVAAAAKQIEDELGPIDVWVNNAFASIF